MKCPPQTELAILRWYAYGLDRGASSECIAAVSLGKLLYGQRSGSLPAPKDHADFLRCMKLIARVPECWLAVGELADKHPRWRGLRDAWHDIVDRVNSDDRTGADRLIGEAIEGSDR